MFLRFQTDTSLRKLTDLDNILCPNDYEYRMLIAVFPKIISAGSTIYVHGQNARPRVINCCINDSENVGIFVNNNAQVRLLGSRFCQRPIF